MDNSVDQNGLEVDNLPGETTAGLSVPKESRYTNDAGQDGLVLLVDTQEMGGERVGLGEVCQLLGCRGVVYRTRRLRSGDYSWVWRTRGREVILPWLVERKRADDLAETLKQGRFWSQVSRMVEWQAGFPAGPGREPSRLYYVVERRPEEYVVRCTDGCQALGQCGNPTLQQVRQVIQDLRQHPHLLVRETASLETTTTFLASLSRELKDLIRDGKFDYLLHQTLPEKTDNGGLISFSAGIPLGMPAPKDIIPPVIPNTKNEKDIINSGRINLETTASTSGNETIKAENLTFDEELELVLEMSKREAAGKLVAAETEGVEHTDVDNTTLSHRLDQCEYGVRQQEDIDSGLVSVRTDRKELVDEKEDLDLALAIERSRQDMGGRPTPYSVGNPLVQYHCSAGGSVIFPNQSGCRSSTEQTGYRPRINRKRPVAREAMSGAERNSVRKETMIGTCTTRNKLDSRQNNSSGGSAIPVKDSMTNSTCFMSNSVGKENIDLSHKVSGTKYPSFYEADKNMKLNDSMKMVKEEPCVDLNAEKPVKHKHKRIKLNLKPSLLNTEINTVHVTCGKKPLGTERRRVKQSCGHQNSVCNGTEHKTDEYASVLSNSTKPCDIDVCAGDMRRPGVCAVSEGVCKETSTDDDSDGGWRSDEDLFRGVPGVTVDTATDASEACTGLPSNSHNDFDIVCRLSGHDGVRASTGQDSPTVPAEESHNSSFSSSCSDLSLPDIDVGVPESTRIAASEDESVKDCDRPRSSAICDEEIRDRAMTTANQAAEEERVTVILSVLPGVSDGVARATLKTCGGDVDRCVSLLLETGASADVVDLTSSQSY